MASTKLSAPTLPKSGAISKGYNFASNWEQNAPLTDQQQAAILTLSHAVAERPFPPNHALDHVSHPDKALFVSVSVSDEDTPIQDSGPVIQPFLVNTNQVMSYPCWFLIYILRLMLLLQTAFFISR
ncbi:hypothetical protein I3842_07G190300 [Carya illinoinensis]|uniref:Uncharacterized protein n=1 Tax=Carya illinoinensis TaxID=32201 RepID=A0A922EPB3_CARIL|nr:hypothetical protein I3842_07G190300 [Carya illinoinensis]